MKKTVLLLLSFVPLFLFAQEGFVNSTELQKEVIELTNTVENLSKQIQTQKILIHATKQELKEQQTINDSLHNQIQQNSLQMNTTAHKLGTEIDKMENSLGSLNNNVSILNQNIYKNKVYWILGSLVLFFIGVLMYILLRKRIHSTHLNVETQIKRTKQSLEEEGIKLDNKLIEILESQLKLRQEELKIKTIKTATDHSLALKVADEIARMQKNLTRFEENTKVVKPLEKGIERIQANFAANGYEIINLLNEDFDDRMNVDFINFMHDDSLEQGKRLITKIIRPQVNYSGKLIQRAQVEVSQN